MIGQQQENLSLIEKTNLILKTAGLNASIISVDQLRFAAPVIFVKVYEVFFGYQLEKVNYSPTNRYDHAMNVDIVLNALKTRYDSPLLHQTTGNHVVAGDVRSIEIIMSIFYGLAQKIINEREDILKSSTNIVDAEPPQQQPQQPKQPKSKTRAFYRSNTTTSQEEIPGELKVIMDRVNMLEGKVHTNIFNTENIAEDEKVDSQRDAGDGNGNRKNKSQKSRPTSAPPGGRRKEKKIETVESESHLVLIGGLDANNAEENVNFDQEDQPAKKRKSTKKKRKKRAKEGTQDASPSPSPSPPFPSPSPPPPQQQQQQQQSETERKYINSKSHSMPYPRQRPSSAGHRRPKPEIPSDHPHDFVKRSSSQQPNSSLMTGLYTYDWRTGHRISQTDAEELLEQKKQRLLALGVIMTDDGELRALDSNVPITIHDIRLARDRQKLGEEKGDHQQQQNQQNQQFKPLTATISEYPGRRTEQSVEDFQKKMIKLREPPEVKPPSKSKTQMFKSYRLLENLDLVISVEHCHECEKHKMTLKHNSEEYISHAEEILKYSAQLIHSTHPCIRLGVIRFPAKIYSKTNSNENDYRVGALEVQVGYKNEKGEVQAELIYSKLNTRRWPSKSVIEKRLTSVLSKYGLQTYSDSGEALYYGRAGQPHNMYPVGIGPWSDVPLADPLWKYTKCPPPPPPAVTAPPSALAALTALTAPAPSTPSAPSASGSDAPAATAPAAPTPSAPSPSVAPPPQEQKPSKEHASNVNVNWCFDSRAYAFFPKYKVGTRVKIHSCPNPFGGVESYTCVGVIRSCYQDGSTLENMVTVLVEFHQVEVSVKEDLCVPFPEKEKNKDKDKEKDNETVPDPFAAPTTIELTSNQIPVVLSSIILYGLANDLIHWKQQDPRDSYTPPTDSKGALLRLGRASLYRQISELVWRGIQASPGLKSGWMILPNQTEEVDVQLAYSPAVLDHLLKLYGGETVNITHLMQLIQPSLSKLTLEKCYEVNNPPSSTTEVPSDEKNKTKEGRGQTTQPSPRVNSPVKTKEKMNDLVETGGGAGESKGEAKAETKGEPLSKETKEDPIISTVNQSPQVEVETKTNKDLQSIPQNNNDNTSLIQPSGVESTEDEYAEDFEMVAKENNLPVSLSFMFLEVEFSNRVNEKLKSLTVELNYREEVQSCKISGLEGPSGKKIGEIDWNVLILQKSDFFPTGPEGAITVTLKHRSAVIGTGQWNMKEVFALPLNVPTKISVSIETQSGIHFVVWFHLMLREKKTDEHNNKLTAQDRSLTRVDSNLFPSELELYPDDYESSVEPAVKTTTAATTPAANTSNAINTPSYHSIKEEPVAPAHRHQIKSDEAYVVKLERITATNLKNVELTGENDPYCLLHFGTAWSFKTSVLDNAGSEAVWNISPEMDNISFFCDGEMISSTPLHVEVYDHNSLRKHEPIGEVHLNMREVLESPNGCHSFNIYSHHKISGIMTITFHLETNQTIQTILDKNEHISLSFDSLKWNTSDTSTPMKKSSLYYALFNLGYWEGVTTEVTRQNNIYTWEEISISQIFPAKLLVQNPLKIEIYKKYQQGTQQPSDDEQKKTSKHSDKLLSRAEVNITDLLTSNQFKNLYHVDTFQSNGTQNGRLFLTITLHSPRVLDTNLEMKNLNQLTTSPPPSTPPITTLATEVNTNHENEDYEKHLLLEIFNCTGGPTHWLDTSLWSIDKRLSDWLNIDLDDNITTATTPISHVIGIRLGSNGLVNSFPIQFCQFKYLLELQLFDNSLTGTIPEAIGNLTSLRVLYLNQNQLTGTIPDTIRNCVNLEEIDLEQNHFNGAIPEALALPKLINLNLSQNSFNRISGSIPLQFLQCKYLKSFLCDLIPYKDSSESIYTIFDWIRAHQPSSSSSSLSPRSASNTIHVNLKKISKSLIHFSQEMLTTSGTSFDTWNEEEEDTSATSISQWEGVATDSTTGQLVSLILVNQSLCGVIPPSIGQLFHLSYLDLSNNSLEGEIPEELFDLTSLQYLFLNNNQLEGEPLLKMTSLPQLKTINFSNNQFSGELIEEFTDLQKLERLDLSQNQFKGELSQEFLNFPCLKELNLSDNKFSGHLPALSGVASLEILNLSKNRFNGTIPESISELFSLRLFDISFNEVTGRLPEGVSKLLVLEEIGLQMTKLEIDRQDPTQAKSILLKKLPSLSRISM